MTQALLVALGICWTLAELSGNDGTAQSVTGPALGRARSVAFSDLMTELHQSPRLLLLVFSHFISWFLRMFWHLDFCENCQCHLHHHTSAQTHSLESCGQKVNELTSNILSPHFVLFYNLPSAFTPVPDPQHSLWLPPCGRSRQDVQPDHRTMPLQGRSHWHHLQPLRQGLPAEPFTCGPLHQWVTGIHTNTTHC